MKKIFTYYVVFKGQLHLWVLSLWRWSNCGSEKWARHAEGRLHALLLAGNQQTNMSKEALWLSLASSKVTALSGGRTPRLVADRILYGVWQIGFRVISMPGQPLWPSFAQGRCEHGPEGQKKGPKDRWVVLGREGLIECKPRCASVNTGNKPR